MSESSKSGASSEYESDYAASLESQEEKSEDGDLPPESQEEESEDKFIDNGGEGIRQNPYNRYITSLTLSSCSLYLYKSCFALWKHWSTFYSEKITSKMHVQWHTKDVGETDFMCLVTVFYRKHYCYYKLTMV